MSMRSRAFSSDTSRGARLRQQGPDPSVGTLSDGDPLVRPDRRQSANAGSSSAREVGCHEMMRDRYRLIGHGKPPDLCSDQFNLRVQSRVLFGARHPAH